MSALIPGVVGIFFGIPRTRSYDTLIRSTGIKTKPKIILSLSRAVTFLLLILSTTIPLIYQIIFQFSHPLLLLPTSILLLIFILELIEVFQFSPIIILISAYVSWKRTSLETELPYAMLFLNQLLSIGMPFESAIEKLKKQSHLKGLLQELECNQIPSEPIQEFIHFIGQCKRVGITPNILEDLNVMSDNYKRTALSRFRSMGNMAIQIFTFVLTLYTATVLFIIVTAINSGSVGLEFFLLDLVNPLLFLLGFFYLIRGGTA